MAAVIPPSVLPDISPSRGEICRRLVRQSLSAGRRSIADAHREVASKLHRISPLEGEMSGRTEGGVYTLPLLATARPAHAA